MTSAASSRRLADRLEGLRAWPWRWRSPVGWLLVLAALALGYEVQTLVGNAARARLDAVVGTATRIADRRAVAWRQLLDLLADQGVTGAALMDPARLRAANSQIAAVGGVVEVYEDGHVMPWRLPPLSPPILLAEAAKPDLRRAAYLSIDRQRMVIIPSLESAEGVAPRAVMLRAVRMPLGSMKRVQLAIPAARLPDLLLQGVAPPKGIEIGLIDPAGAFLSFGTAHDLLAPPRHELQVARALPELPDWQIAAHDHAPPLGERLVLHPGFPFLLALLMAVGAMVVLPVARRPRAALAKGGDCNDCHDLMLREMRHELRTLTVTAALQCETLLASPPDSAIPREAIGVLQVALQAMQSLEDQMAGVPPAQARFAPEVLLGRVLALVRPMAEASGVLLQSDLARIGPPDEVTGPRDALVQVALNLLINAVKYAPGRPVRLELRHDARPDPGGAKAGTLVLRVVDHGPGIPRKLRARLFLPGMRGAAATAGVSGEGLGLAIVQRLMTAVGGSIRVDSKLGRGSSFTAEFPVLPAGAPPVALLRGRSVLLVEDSPAVRQWLSARLVEQEARVVAVATAAEARRAVADGGFDTALIDLGLPDGCGLTLGAEFAARPAPMLLVAYSAEMDAARRQACLDAGFSRIHLKSSDAAALIADLAQG